MRMCPQSGQIFSFACEAVFSWFLRSIDPVMPRRKSFLPRLNSFKQRSESLTRCCFWSGVSKRGTHFGNNLRIPKDSCKIVNTLPSDIFEVSAISCNFNLRSPKTILWNFVNFSSRWLLIPPMQSPHNVYQATALLQQYFFPSKSNVWLALETFFYPLFWR